MGRRIRRKRQKLMGWDKQFNRIAKEEENNSKNTFKKNIQSAIFSPPNAHLVPGQQITLLQPAPLPK